MWNENDSKKVFNEKIIFLLICLCTWLVTRRTNTPITALARARNFLKKGKRHEKTKSMTQTLDRFRLLRTCFLNISIAELQQANFSVVSESFSLLCISVNAHGIPIRYKCMSLHHIFLFFSDVSILTFAFDTGAMKKSFQDNRYRYSRGNPPAPGDSHLRDNGNWFSLARRRELTIVMAFHDIK